MRIIVSESASAIAYWDNLASVHGYSRYPGETNEQLKARILGTYNMNPRAGVAPPKPLSAGMVLPKAGMHARYKLSKRVGIVTAVNVLDQKLDVDWQDGWKGAGFPWHEFEFARLLVAGIPIFHSDGVSGETVVYHDERPTTVVTSTAQLCAKCGTQSKHAESETSMGLCFDCFEARR